MACCAKQDASCAQAASELLVGDLLLACAALAYCGAMPHDCRMKLVQTWHQELRRRNIAVSDTFSVAAILSNPTEVSVNVHVPQ